jgi:hypothetical protein
LILRIARDYLFTSGLQDERSEDEDSGDEKADGKVRSNGEAMANGHTVTNTTAPAEAKKDI